MKETAVHQIPEENLPVVLENLGYAKKLAYHFYGERNFVGVNLEDFESAAYLGLCDAARRFKVDKGASFRTFCYLRIRGAMIDLLRSAGVAPRNYFQHSAHEDNPFVFVRSVRELRTLVESIDTLNVKLHQNSEDSQTEISYADDITPEGLAHIKFLHSYLQKIIKELPEEEQTVIQLRYYGEKSFDDIRETFGDVSKSWIYRLHMRALDSIRIVLCRDARTFERAQAKELLYH